MSALGLYGSLILICAASALIGQAVLGLCGRRAWSWIAPAVGLAVLILAAGLTIRLPGRGTTAAAAIGVLLVLSLLVLWRRTPEGLRHATRVGLPIALMVAVAASLPFAAAGGFGELGVQVNNDLGIHLQNADWLRTHAGPQPVQVSEGYPVGPHAVVVAVAELTGASLREAFTALLISVPILLAGASLALLGKLAPWRRALAALLVGLPYLAASFYVQSAFKETLMGLFVLAFALSLRELAGEGEARDAPEATPSARRAAASTIRASIPLALIVAACVQTYTYPGVYWATGTAALWVAAAFVARGGLRAPGETLRRLWPLLSPLAVGTAILIAITAPALARITSFIESQESSFGGTFGQTAIGNLFGPIPPEEVTGVWFSSDLRFAPPGDAVASIFALLAVVALGVAIVRLFRRRELALLAGLVTSGVIYLGTLVVSSDYVQSKGLAIAAPIVMLCVLAGLLEPARAPALEKGTLGDRARRYGIRVRDFVALAGPRELASLGRSILVAAFVVAALFSTYLVLGGAAVGPQLRSEELPDLESQLDGRRVAFLAFGDDYSDFELLRAASVDYAGSARTGLPRRFDFDSLRRDALGESDMAIEAHSPLASEPPDGFRRVDSTDHFTLWARDGSVPPRRTLGEDRPSFGQSGPPGAVLDCGTRRGRALGGQRGAATVIPTPPELGPPGRWSESAPLPRVARESVESSELNILNPGVIAIDAAARPSQRLRLSRGRWEISLQYSSPEGLVVEAPGLRSELPPLLDPPGPFWPAGSLRVTEPGPVGFSVHVEKPPLLRRVLQGPEGLRTRPEAVIGSIAATRVEPRRTISLHDACREFVDHYRLR